MFSQSCIPYIEGIHEVIVPCLNNVDLHFVNTCDIVNNFSDWKSVLNDFLYVS